MAQEVPVVVKTCADAYAAVEAGHPQAATRTSFPRSLPFPSSDGLSRLPRLDRPRNASTARRGPPDLQRRSRRPVRATGGGNRWSLRGVGPPPRALAQEPSLLPPERAFSFSVARARRRVRGSAIRDRQRLLSLPRQAQVRPGTRPRWRSPPVLPPGKIKEDQFFGKVETYRGQLVVRLALAAPAAGVHGHR